MKMIKEKLFKVNKIIRNSIVVFFVFSAIVFPAFVQELLPVKNSSFYSVEASQKKKKSNNLTQKAKKSPTNKNSNAGKNKIFNCKGCGREVKTTLDSYKAMTETYQKGYCSANCKNAKSKQNKKNKRGFICKQVLI